MINTLRSLAGAVVLSMVCAGSAMAQGWPQKPVKIVVTSAPGSGPDTLTRYIAARLSKSLGQSVVVENRPGANGVIGTQAVANAVPDGYTFLLATSSVFSVNRYTVKALPYDPEKDFQPVVLVATGGLAVIANPAAPIKTLADVVALDKRQPGKMSVATEGPVAGTILAYLNEVLGTKLVQIPHTSASMALQDAMTGRTELSVASIVLSLPYIKNGQVRPIAVATSKRDASLPDVPTIGETSPGFGINAWTMVVAPTGTPADVVQRMNVELNKILKDAEVARWMMQFGNHAEGGTSAAAADFVRTDALLWEKITRAAGIKPQ